MTCLFHRVLPYVGERSAHEVWAHSYGTHGWGIEQAGARAKKQHIMSFTSNSLETFIICWYLWDSPRQLAPGLKSFQYPVATELERTAPPLEVWTLSHAQRILHSLLPAEPADVDLHEIPDQPAGQKRLKEKGRPSRASVRRCL